MCETSIEECTKGVKYPMTSSAVSSVMFIYTNIIISLNGQILHTTYNLRENTFVTFHFKTTGLY